jgi:cyclophilin family peptidyl-prolyl cis-trans isomerase
MWIFLLAAALADPAGSKAAASPPRVTLSTSKGEIVVELYPDKAPATVKSFLAYVDEKFYDGTIFHRVIPGFMIQGGGFTADMNQKATHAPVKNEAANGLSNVRGSIAMARTSDPHSATAQFFVNLKDNTFLDRAQAQDGWGYTVFGKVVSGMETVDAIAGVPTGTKAGMSDVPKQTVTLTTARQGKS